MGNSIKRCFQPPIHYEVRFLNSTSYEVYLLVNQVPQQYLSENLIKPLLNSSSKQKFYFKKDNVILVFPHIDRIQFNKVILKLPFKYYRSFSIMEVYKD